MSYNIFLDNFKHFRKPVEFNTEHRDVSGEAWVVARTYEEFCNVILTRKSLPDYISFDYDLGDRSERPKTGWHCAQFVCDCCLAVESPPPKFGVHSTNEEAKRAIEGMLRGFDNFTRFGKNNTQ